MASTFLALQPAKGLLYRLSDLQRSLRPERTLPKLRFVPWYKFHLTLIYWQKFDDALLPQLKKTLERLQETSIESHITGFHFFSKAQVIFLKEVSADIIHLQKQVQILLQQPYNFLTELPEREFIPHWTLARKFKPVILQEEPAYFSALDKFCFSGQISRLVAYRTLPGRYHELFTIPLRK